MNLLAKFEIIDQCLDASGDMVFKHYVNYGVIGGREQWMSQWRKGNGDFHRTGEAAVNNSDSYEGWYQHGQLHRDDGPAQIWPAHTQHLWWKHGKPYKPSAHDLMIWKMKKKEKES
jgi:hypothetical protein